MRARANVKKLTIPEIRHCMLALAQKLGGTDGELLRYLAEQTKRAPRGSKGDKGGSSERNDEHKHGAAANTDSEPEYSAGVHNGSGGYRDENQPQG